MQLHRRINTLNAPKIQTSVICRAGQRGRSHVSYKRTRNAQRTHLCQEGTLEGAAPGEGARAEEEGLFPRSQAAALLNSTSRASMIYPEQ